MNRLRSHKFKLNTDADNNINNNNNNNINTNNNSNGLLTKISKRYSTISNKITRRHLPGRKSTSPQKIISGSYDMTGSHSDDHKLEIGAPILISTTTIDTDRLDVTEARLKQIGGGIAQTSTTVHTMTMQFPIPAARQAAEENGAMATTDFDTATETETDTTANTTHPSTAQSSPTQVPSSGSETEVFVDALDTTPMTEERPMLLLNKTPMASDQQAPVLTEISDNGNGTIAPAVNPLTNYYEATKVPRSKWKLRKPQHSVSVQNLHRSELKVFLQKAPSMELNSMENQLTIVSDPDTSQELPDLPELPNLPELYGTSRCNIAASDNEEQRDELQQSIDEIDANKENNSPEQHVLLTSLSKSEPYSPQEQHLSSYLNDQLQLNKSIDSLSIYNNGGIKRRAVFASNASISQPRGSKQSLNSQISHNSTIADFDLKSVSCQSLNAQSLFVSIDELNEITRQINETEDFNREIDLEYCTHRDNLKPSERRITLLKNKNSRLISFNNNKEKLKKSWSGVKNWIGEESHRIKEAVNKQPTLQRIASSRLNLSGAESKQSVHGSRVLRQGSQSMSREQSTTRDCEALANSTFSLANGVVGSPLADVNISCVEIAEENFEDSNEFNEADGEADGDDSPANKRAREEGQNGFEELRRYIKQGGDFGKELILILQERVDAEMLYSKSLSKMANKLNKACRELPGTIADAWRGVATEMESRSDIHRQLSTSLTDEIVKPLKNIVDGHHKSRKSVENNVDKASRVLSEWRVSEAKAKKSSHTAARENEKLQDAMLDVRIQKSPSIALLHQGPNKLAAEKEIKSAEKDCAKLDQKRKKAEEAVKRADVEYYTLCVRAERARVDWEVAVLRGSSFLQNLENQRLITMKTFVSNYTRLTANMNPVLDALVQRLQPQADACNVVKDMQIVKNIRRNAEGPSEQLLPDFYCEHTTLAMNRERRKHALIKLLQLVKTDLERERRSRNGLKGLSQTLNNPENQNITDKLYHIRSMLTYLEGARFKLHSALLELDHKPRSSHPLAQHIQITRDRTGLQQSILKVPMWLKNNDKIHITNNPDEAVRENDYEMIANAMGTMTNSTSNGNGSSESIKDAIVRPFSRSKSNIETFSATTQICLAKSTVAANEKTKTMSNINDPYYDRGQADGGSNQQDSDFDEFSSQDEDEEQCSTQSTARKDHKVLMEKTTTNGLNGNEHHQQQQQTQNYYQNAAELSAGAAEGNNNNNNIISSSNNGTIVLSRCKALYSYTPKLYDELELNPGDIIEVHAKQDDGWWLGALRNQIGIFPATYVEEFA